MFQIMILSHKKIGLGQSFYLLNYIVHKFTHMLMHCVWVNIILSTIILIHFKQNIR